MVVEAVAPPGSFLASPGGGRSPLAHDDGPPAGVFGFTGGAGVRPLRIGPPALVNPPERSRSRHALRRHSPSGPSGINRNHGLHCSDRGWLRHADMQYLVGQSQSLKETLEGHGAELRVGILA
jgi:hypothetical protein